MRFWVLLALVLASPAHAVETGVASVDDGKPTRFDGGGGKFTGWLSTGKRFDVQAMTAAHRTLPPGSCILARHGRRFAFLTIDDVGPCGTQECQATAPRRVRERILDLKPRAAARLGVDGLGRVTIWPMACQARAAP